MAGVRSVAKGANAVLGKALAKPQGFSGGDAVRGLTASYKPAWFTTKCGENK
jgi:hypothetical protein